MLDVAQARTDNGASLIRWDWRGGDNQRRLFTAPMVAEHGAKSMAGASMADGAVVVQWAPDGHAGQVFRLEPVQAEYVRLVCRHGGKVFTVRNGSCRAGTRRCRPSVQWSATSCSSR